MYIERVRQKNKYTTQCNRNTEMSQSTIKLHPMTSCCALSIPTKDLVSTFKFECVTVCNSKINIVIGLFIESLIYIEFDKAG